MYRTLCVLAAAIGLLYLPTSALADIVVNIRFEVTDLSNNPISTIEAGEDFRLRALVQDVRNPPAAAGGVFAAWLNGTYDDSLAAPHVPPGVVFDPFFPLVPTADLSTPGEINGAGAAALSLSAPGTAEQLLFYIDFEALAPGVVAFTPFFDPASGHDVLLYLGEAGVPEEQILFLSDTLTITPEPSSVVLGAGAAASLALYGWRRRRRGAVKRTAAKSGISLAL
jgi:hypothetical protein